jgi:peptidoglycan/LPS O-acetylase OafA/YrhL
MVGNFRTEIGGLRAVAVISVVLFHLKVGGFQGGFVGVDVFFVISGYLITRNILGDLQAGRFSFGEFYVRRVRRIFPALIFTVVATYLVGALFCSPLMFLDLAKECTHALLSISNIQYWRESHRYFAPGSDELALLHCWSLSLEEQFYLVWPVLIALAWKSRRVFVVITVAGFASFLLSVFVVKADPLAAFFLMPFRIFEFAIGAMVLPFEQRTRPGKALAEIMSTGGILCLAIGILLFDSNMPHLEVAILLPCLATAAIIWAGNTTRASRLLTSPAMVAIGGISYSLYLCHWPIIFFARFIFGEGVNAWTGVIAMSAVMLAVATAMNLFIERRFIQPSALRSAGFLKNAAVFWSVVLALVAVTHATFLSRGFAWRLSQAQAGPAYLQDFPRGIEDPVEGPVGLELVGDSLAIQYMAGLSPILKQLNIHMEVLGGAGCPILDGVTLKVPRDECRSVRDRSLKRLGETNLPIIFAQRWDLYNDSTIDYQFETEKNVPQSRESFVKLRLSVERTFEKLIAGGHRILVIGGQVDASCPINRPRLLQGPLPHLPEPPCPLTTRAEARQATAPFDQMLSEIRSKWPDKIELLRPVDYICDTDCPTVKDGIWLYFERSHFSVAGSKYIVARAAEVFRTFLGN